MRFDNFLYRCSIFNRLVITAWALFWCLPLWCGAVNAKNVSTETPQQEIEKAWSNYYQTVEEIRAQVESSNQFKNNPDARAKAYHELMGIQALAFNLVIAPRMTNPRLLKALAYQTDIYATGMPGPDFVYALTFLDGSQVYKLSGRAAAGKMFVIQTWGTMWGQPGYEKTTTYDLSDMEVAPDGSFEITIGGPKQGGNWIPLNPESDFQPWTFRRQVASWSDDIGELSLQRISPIEKGHYDQDEFDLASQAVRIRRAAEYLKFLGKSFVLGLYNLTLSSCDNHKNVMCLWDASGKEEITGTGMAHYIAGIFQVKEDEALLIEVPEPPEAKYWSFQVGDIWARSLPFYERQVALNMDNAAIDSDGKIRVVLSHKDPGLVNWLDTVGRNEGVILYRVYFPDGKAVPPTVTKVKFDELGSLLPKDSKRISAEERKKKLEIHRKNVYRVMDE